MDCCVIPLLLTLTIRSNRSQKIRCPLRRRQTRNPFDSPPDVRKGATYTIHLANALKLLISPDRPRAPNLVQSRYRPRKNLHSPPLQAHLPQSPSTHCPLGRGRLRSLLLHGPILRATHSVSTHSSCLGSHRSKSDLHSRKHDVYHYRHFQCLD